MEKTATRKRTRPEESPKAEHARQLRRQAGRWLGAQREHAGLTQAQVAERVGLRYYTFVSQVEGGHGRVPSEHFKSWAQAIGVPTHEFAKTLLKYYEPDIFPLLFPDEADAAE
ncbi:MAG TPA: helix-turn-helix transcriptional regulator [Azospirillaceae bacterium]|nr:helix-turn-helix transcriptional regulator [Azospirillaceae bacterium]